MQAGRQRFFRAAAALLVSSLSFLFRCDSAGAQTNLQLWGNVTIDWQKVDRLTYAVDLEPKVLLTAPAGDPEWATFDVTPKVDYAARRWLDLTGELLAGYTAQTNDVNSVELTPRAGVRFHLFSRAVPVRIAGHVNRDRELPPRRRLVLRDYVRVEWRNLFYSDDTDNSSTGRLRNRIELLFPLNRALMTNDGARYLMADWEWFIPFTDVSERFANKQRVRTGVGWRRSRDWRFEALGVWDRSRHTISDGFTTSDYAMSVQVKRVF